MTWIKICGITNLEDAQTAVDAGAHAVGFVFYQRSPRMMDTDSARQIVEKLPPGVEKVGVFVDQDLQQISDIVWKTGLTAVQLHGRGALNSAWGDQRPLPERLGVSKVILAMPGDSLKNTGVSINERARDEVFALLLDAQANGQLGGTGTSFDWQGTRGMVQILSFHIPVIVAGGLNSSNVGEAMRLLQPFGVDVSSGVEESHRKKDPAKVQAFVEAVRRAEKST
jgi:phosphoribosylanthranilate isomerase